MSRRAADPVVLTLARSLRPLGDAERAAGERAYLKSDLEFWGLRADGVRRAVRAFDRERSPWSRAELRRFVRVAWGCRVHELRCAAIELLVRHVAELGPADLPMLEGLLRDSRTWAYVDTIAVHVVGPIVERAPRSDRTLERWARDPDFWVRRSALLALLGPLARGADAFPRFARLAGPMVGEREFFIRKAIGWVLREVGKRRPELVVAFLQAHQGAVAGLTYREATKYLPTEMRHALERPGTAAARPARRARGSRAKVEYAPPASR